MKEGPTAVPSIIGWVIDVLAGWVVGSIAFGLAFGAIGYLLGIQPGVADGTGVLVGTVVGIFAMRRHRTRNVRRGSVHVGSGLPRGAQGTGVNGSDVWAGEQSVRWVIEQLAQEATSQGQSLSQANQELLRTPVPKLLSDHNDAVVAHVLGPLNNYIVGLMRANMVRLKRSGEPTAKVRPGLRIPAIWLHHYALLSNASDAAVVKMLGSALSRNSIVGETRDWRSN